MRNTDSIGNIIHLHLYNTFHFRTPLIGVIVLCLCVFGTPLFTCTSGPTISEQNHVAPLPLKSTSTPVPSRGPTARTPSLVPTPQPISPLPLNVQQQVAVLEAHDRFFYHGNTSLPEIALTFDDGPNPPYTTQVLTILQRYGIHATFFCMGKHVQQYPDLVRQEYRQGNLVENHTWSHPSLLSLNESSITWQLLTTANIIEYVIGERPTLFRPPYGEFNASVLKTVNTFGLSTFIWNVDPADWSMPGTRTISTRVLHRIGDGSIVLLHDGGGDRSQTVAALPVIIEWLQRHGYMFVTLKQLVSDMHKHTTFVSAAPIAIVQPKAHVYILAHEREGLPQS